MIMLMILMFKSVEDINEDASDYAKRLLLVLVVVIKKTRKNIKCVRKTSLFEEIHRLYFK